MVTLITWYGLSLAIEHKELIHQHTSQTHWQGLGGQVVEKGQPLLRFSRADY